jgi:hypothetical protein
MLTTVDAPDGCPPEPTGTIAMSDPLCQATTQPVEREATTGVWLEEPLLSTTCVPAFPLETSYVRPTIWPGPTCEALCHTRYARSPAPSAIPGCVCTPASPLLPFTTMGVACSAVKFASSVRRSMSKLPPESSANATKVRAASTAKATDGSS